ncbi:MAG TPA: 2-dehydro-3-deoxygalactonokinase [Puia sp.]|jgi:2-dehydro-3-deoxygalactonokinase|nr:2-dehydro-3-deoxygalactonokinase [Puia sp.]
MLISCDWGTSSFRLRAVEHPSGRVVAAHQTDYGIAAAFSDWQRSELPEQQRAGFYRSILYAAIDDLQRQHSLDLHGVTILLSGMVSSSLGIQELPYHLLPFDVSGADLGPTVLPPTLDFPHAMLLIPGIRSYDDVMRGEETQLIGCQPPREKDERMYIFPGTHSKHILVREGRAIGFRTYMTGEFFSLLTQKSLLALSVGKPAHPSLTTAFYAGIDAARGSTILHSAFSVRTNQLFKRLSKEDNYQYLSGLLIAEELKSLGPRPVTLVATAHLLASYQAALQYLGGPPAQTMDADLALVRGHGIVWELNSPRG